LFVPLDVKTMPLCTSAGVVPRLPIWYQRTPFRVTVPVALPVLSTPMLCPVQRLPLRMMPFESRSSRLSSWPLAPPVLPRCGTRIG